MAAAPAKTEAPKAEEKPYVSSPLSAMAFKATEYARTAYVATIPALVTLDDVLKPNYWTNIASNTALRLQPTDHIECVWEDFSQYAELLVIRPTKVAVTVGLIQHVDLRAGSGDIDLGNEMANYLVRFAGAGIGYRIIYKPDNTVVKGDGLPTETAARQWLVNHLADGTRAAPKTEVGGDKKAA